MLSEVASKNLLINKYFIEKNSELFLVKFWFNEKFNELNISNYLFGSTRTWWNFMISPITILASSIYIFTSVSDMSCFILVCHHSSFSTEPTLIWKQFLVDRAFLQEQRAPGRHGYLNLCEIFENLLIRHGILLM